MKLRKYVRVEHIEKKTLKMHKPRKERNYDNGGIPAELVRKFFKEYDLKDGKSISDFLKKSFGTFIQEALENELDQELGYSRYNYQTKETTNSRNGHHKKTLRTDIGPVEIQVPQDTEGEFEPVIVPKHSREVNPDIQDAIISMYSKGMSTVDVNSHLQRIYGFEISAETVSRITDKVLPIAKEWQKRPLANIYPIIFLDGVVFNVVEDGTTKKKTSYRTSDSLFKLLYLVSQDIQEKWTMPISNWGLILNQLMIYFEGRIC